MKKKISLLLVAIFSLLILGSCAKEPVKVVFGDAGWDSMKFHNAVAMYIAKTAYDMETEQVSGTTAITYGGLNNNEIQVYMEAWVEGLFTYDEDIAAGTITELSVNYDDNAQGLYVPRYVIEGDEERGIEPMAPDLVTVEDLSNYADVFVDPDNPSQGRILGSIAGWEVDEILRAKVEYYGLDEYYYYTDPGSDAALAASIAAAYERGEAIVAYYWEPAWITGQYDLVLLEDAPYDDDLYYEGGCEYPAMRVTVCANTEFIEENPEFAEFLSNYETSSALTSEALSYIKENNASYEDAAKWFLTEHDEFIDAWLPSDKAEIIHSALNG